MARYFTLASTRGQGISKMMEKAKAEPGTPITLYAAKGTSPPLYLVGDYVADAIQAGMIPVFTFIAHPRPLPVVSPHFGERESLRCWEDLEEEAR